MQYMEAFGEELKGMKDDVLEKDQKLFNSEVTIGRLELEVARLQEEAENMRAKESEMSNQMKEYIMKAKEAEVEKDATDNILQAQLNKAHEEIAELREQVESAKAKDHKIQTLEVERAELVMEKESMAAKSSQLEMENKELLKLKDEFKGTEKGELMEEIMHLKRQVELGKKEYYTLKEENMKLKTSDNFALRNSFLAPSPDAPAEHHIVRKASNLDPKTQNLLLGEIQTEIDRLKHLSDGKDIPEPASHMKKRATLSETEPMDDLYLNEMPETGGMPGDFPSLDMQGCSTMEPIWELPIGMQDDVDAPLPTGLDAK